MPSIPRNPLRVAKCSPSAALAVALLVTAIPTPAQARAPTDGAAPLGTLHLSPPTWQQQRGDLSDIYVQPTRPGQNRVPYWDWDWQTIDLGAERGGGGIRLFFYERERAAASYAAAALLDQYHRLTDRFHYLPRTIFPFILYASYSEFQATNVFTIGEGTLGVTDPRDLRMAMPFFGDIHEFERVSTHEMAHQFTIQKMRDASIASGLGSGESTLEAFPLWFIEGIAEYMTFDGLDPQAEYILRDLVTHPNPAAGYALPGFFEARAGGYIGIYKLGQARVTFLAETYGHQALIELMEQSPLIAKNPFGAPEPIVDPRRRSQLSPRDAGVADDSGGADGSERPDGGGEPPDASDAGYPSDAGDSGDADIPDGGSTKKSTARPRNFAELLAKVVGESAELIDERYKDWLKHRFFHDYLDAGQRLTELTRLKGLEGEPDSFSASPDGQTLFYRSVERETGQSTLRLLDARDPGSAIEVACDQHPGLESLHPVDRRVTALGGAKLAYIGRSGEADQLFVRRWSTRKKGSGHALSLGRVRRFHLGELLEAYDPALSPDGSAVAFVGIDRAGFRDLYRLQIEGKGAGELTRLSDDEWAEADVAWDGGRLLFISDQTDSRERALFALDLATLKKQRLAELPAEIRAPAPAPALGGILLRSFYEGRPNLYLLKESAQGERDLTRLTDLASAPLAAHAAPEGALWLLAFHSGTYGLYRMESKSLLAIETPLSEPPPAEGVGGSGDLASLEQPYRRALMPKSRPYDPTSPSNWRFEAAGAALVGTAAIGAAGLAVTDLLRDHTLFINLAIYGQLELTDASAIYLDQSRRPALGLGLFHTFEPVRDKTFPETLNYYLARRFGLVALAQYPFDRFRRIEANLQLRGVERFSFTDRTGLLGGQWRDLNGGVEPELAASLAFGQDTQQLHFFAGPISGSSAFATLGLGYLPQRESAYLQGLLDLQQRVRLIGRSSLLGRLAYGTTTTNRFAPQFYLFAVGNLEGFHLGDLRLLADNYYVSNLKLSFPVDPFLQIPFLSGIFGVAGLDFGAAFDRYGDAWEKRSLSAVLGTDLALGVLVLQLHFGKLIPIGGEVGAEPWAFNLGLRYLYQ